MDQKLLSRLSVGALVGSFALALLLFEYFFPSFIFIGTIVFLAVVCGCALEATNLSETSSLRRVLGFFLYVIPSFLILALSFAAPTLVHAFTGSIIIAVTMFLGAIILVLKDSLEGAEDYIAKLSLNFLVIGLGGLSAVFVSMLERAPLFVFFSAVIVSLADIIAYFVGPRFSLSKLARAISPNKDLAGSLAAVLLGGVVGSLLGYIGIGVNLIDGFILGFFLAYVSVLGDLAQSLVKRIAGVKDSGGILKGHGGLYDRFDSHFGGMMVMALYVVMKFS